MLLVGFQNIWSAPLTCCRPVVVYPLVELSSLKVYLPVLFRHRSRHEQLGVRWLWGQEFANLKGCFPKLLPLYDHHSTSQFPSLSFSLLKPGSGDLSFLTLQCTSCDYACIPAQALGRQRYKMQSRLPLPSWDHSPLPQSFRFLHNLISPVSTTNRGMALGLSCEETEKA